MAKISPSDQIFDSRAVANMSAGDSHKQQGEDAEYPPFKWAKYAVEHSGKSMGIACSMQCFCVLLLVVLLAIGADVVPFTTDVPLYIRDNPSYERTDAFLVGRERADLITSSDGGSNSRIGDGIALEVLYVSDSDNVLTPVQLLQIQAMEQKAKSFSTYESYCQLQTSPSDPAAGPQCIREASVLNFFDPEFVNANNISLSKYFDPVAEAVPNLNQGNVDLIRQAWANFNSTRGKEEVGIAFAPIWEVVEDDFGSGFDIATPGSIGNPNSKAVRSLFRFGLPLPGYSSETDRRDEQIADIGVELFDTYDDWGSDANSDADGFRVYYQDTAGQMGGQAILGALMISLVLTIAAIVFVWVYICFMTRSCFLGSLAMGQILFSMVPALLLYRYMFQQAYFGTFNILSIFIILGIGADDIFVFVDHFTASGGEHVSAAVSESLVSRMSWTWRKAGKAMLVTSLTTVFAFLSNAVSSFPAVYTFGIFSALLVFVNYCCVISYWMVVMSVFTQKYERDRCCMVNRCCPRFFSKKEKADGPAELGVIENFFKYKYAPNVILNPIVRSVILVGFLGLIAVLVFFAVQLAPDPETPQIHKAGTNYADFGDVKSEYFGGRLGNPEEFSVFLQFGMEGVDRAGTLPTNAKDRGQVIFDEDFDFSAPEDQQFIVDLCAAAADRSNGNPRQVKSTFPGDSPVKCFMEAFRDWYNDEDTGKPNASLQFPVTASHCPENAAKTCFYNALIRFMSDPKRTSIGLTNLNNFDRWKKNLFAESVDGAATPRFFTIEVELDAAINLDFKDGIALHDVWESWFNEQLQNRPASGHLDSGFQFTLGAWHYFFLQDQLTQEAFTGIGISLTLAFIILAISTQNWIMATLATGTIGLIVMGVVAFTVMMGWKLGALEAINLILVPGLAVDYTVHLADGYLESHAHTRAGKVTDMLTEIGVSVISGAISTLGATLVMMFAPVSFFFKFALFIFSTIAFSLLFSLGLFTSLLAVIGPEKDQGDLGPLFDPIIARCCGVCLRKKKAAEPDHEDVQEKAISVQPEEEA